MSNAFGAVGGSSPTAPCPCGAGDTYERCCGRLHQGTDATTAEELMRSRYAAFAVGDAPYLMRTWHPRTRPESLSLDPRHRWTRLEVLSTTAGSAHDDLGTVTYRVTSRKADGASHVLTERARFERRAGRWVYVDGEVS